MLRNVTAARLREAIRSGEIQPEPNRDPVNPDPNSVWEWAVAEIYRLERAAENEEASHAD
jgi:hypothetical protein